MFVSYSEKLRDPRWQRKRLEILERDHWLCKRCWSLTDQLQVHHKLYRSGVEPWDYEAEVYETLCASCHETATPSLRIPFSRKIASDIAAMVALPLAEALRGYDDLAVRTWREYEQCHEPASEQMAECRAIADEVTITRLVNRLAFEGKLRQYAYGTWFLELVRFSVITAGRA